MKHMLNTVGVFLAVVALIGCGEEAAAPAEDAVVDTNAGGVATSLNVDSTEGGGLTYQQSTLEAPAGTIEITFDNIGALPHNLTIAPEGEADAVNQEAQANAPAYNSPTALAQTKLIDGNASDTITVELEPGTYTFLCTFPGHYQAGMKGTLVVR